MEWIFTNERLPKESDGQVLVCMPNEFPYNHTQPYPNCKQTQRVRTAHYSEFSDTWYYEMGATSKDKPIAWMPLPEPII